MSIQKLKQVLQAMPETGESGFEGLAKRLLELCLHEQFVLARSGDQPSGDAHSLSRTVCVQAKRYSDASPQAKNIEGDFDESLRSLPNTDIYVLAVTRETAQLNDTLDAMRKKSAVDVVVWDFGGAESALPTLCIEYWEQLKSIPALARANAALNKWITTARTTPEHKGRNEQLHLIVRECTQTLLFIQTSARAYLSRRFQMHPNEEPPPLQSIRLPTAVERTKYKAHAVNWWSSDKKRVFVITAPEGYGNPPFERFSQAETELRLGSNRMIRGIGRSRLPTKTISWSSTVDSWGVDLGNTNSALSNLGNRQELLDEEFDLWRLEEDQIKNWEHYELRTFGAWSALETWSKLYPEEFLARARALLTKTIGDPLREWHLGGFLHALVCCLLPSTPDEAWRFFTALNKGRLRLAVKSDYDIPEFFSALWDPTKCGRAQHHQLRRDILKACQNEFEIMVQCIAALGNNADQELERIAEEQFQEVVSRERALGVSILAWVGTDKAAERLTSIAQSDPSRWVREHAEWAREVSLQEKCARSLFRQLTHETDPFKLSSGLQVLKPALTPLARWWHTSILKEENETGLVLTPKSAAILESFWFHITSSTKSHIKVFGRELDEFCRGEKLERLKTAKLAPWWDPL